MMLLNLWPTLWLMRRAHPWWLQQCPIPQLPRLPRRGFLRRLQWCPLRWLRDSFLRRRLHQMLRLHSLIR